MKVLYEDDSPALIRERLRTALSKPHLDFDEIRALIIATSYQLPNWVAKQQEPMARNEYCSKPQTLKTLCDLRLGWVESIKIIESSASSDKVKNILASSDRIHALSYYTLN